MANNNSNESKRMERPRPRLLAPTFLLAAFQGDTGSSPARAGAGGPPSLSQQVTPPPSQPSQSLQLQQRLANEGTPLIGSGGGGGGVGIGSPFRQGLWSTWGRSASGSSNVESPVSNMGNEEAGLPGIGSPSSPEDRRT
jgi:hypothetical protein